MLRINLHVTIEKKINITLKIHIASKPSSTIFVEKQNSLQKDDLVLQILQLSNFLPCH